MALKIVIAPYEKLRVLTITILPITSYDFITLT